MVITNLLVWIESLFINKFVCMRVGSLSSSFAMPGVTTSYIRAHRAPNAQKSPHMAGRIMWLPGSGDLDRNIDTDDGDDDDDDSDGDSDGDSESDDSTPEEGCYNHPVVILSNQARKRKVVVLIVCCLNFIS